MRLKIYCALLAKHNVGNEVKHYYVACKNEETAKAYFKGKGLSLCNIPQYGNINPDLKKIGYKPHEIKTLEKGRAVIPLGSLEIKALFL